MFNTLIMNNTHIAYSFAEIGLSIPLKSYKAWLHEQHAQSMKEKNQQLNKEFLQKECHGVFYVTLCLQSGGEYLHEDNITRKVESLESSGEIELETIMDQDSDDEDCNRVLLLGGPGTGKTTISQTLSYRWGIRELWDEKYDFVFHLTCRKLKDDCRIKTNILQLLIKHHPTQNIISLEEELYQHIKSYGDRVLVIIDGLDELEGWKEVVKKHNQEDQRQRMVKSKILEKHPVSELIYNLAFGRLEEKVEVLLTSRPNESVISSHFKKSLYALGFNEDAIDECSFALCKIKENEDALKQDEVGVNKHTNLMKYVREERPSLYYLCVVPLNCVLLWSRLLEDRESIKSLTDLSLSIVMACVRSREEGNRGIKYDLKNEQKQLLLSMARLAFTQFNSNNLIFTKKDLKECNIDVDASSVNNLMEIHCSDAAESDVQASFIHLSIQEFLAAVHVCLNWRKKDVKNVATVDRDSRRMDNVQLYTAGLLCHAESGHKFLQALDKRYGNKTKLYQKQAKKYVKYMRTSEGYLSSLTKLQMIRCANEGRMTEMVEEVAKAVLEGTMDEVNMLDLSETDGGLLPHHLVSIGYFVQESGQIEGLK